MLIHRFKDSVYRDAQRADTEVAYDMKPPFLRQWVFPSLNHSLSWTSIGICSCLVLLITAILSWCIWDELFCRKVQFASVSTWLEGLTSWTDNQLNKMPRPDTLKAIYLRKFEFEITESPNRFIEIPQTFN